MVAIAAVTISGPSFAGAQAAELVSSDPVCHGCTIGRELVTTLGLSGGRLASRPSYIVRDSRGRFFAVTPEAPQSLPLVFDGRGAFVGAVGREGRGPREFLDPVAIAVTSGDTLLIIDRGNSRMSVLDASLRELRTAPVPATTNGMVVLDSHDVILNASVRDRERIGHPFHRLDAMGNYLGAFGADAGGAVRPGDVSSLVRWMAPAGGDRFWSMRFEGEYVLELWDATGQRHRRLERSASWFPPYERPENITPSRPPQSRGMGVWLDRDAGHLWSLVHVADRRWQEGLGPARRLEGQLVYPVQERQRVFDAIIEVIEVKTARMVAWRRFDETFDLPIGEGLYGAIRESPDGIPYVEVWRLRLERN
jgi:hypothetical protein